MIRPDDPIRDIHVLSAPKASPDGARLAFIATTTDADRGVAARALYCLRVDETGDPDLLMEDYPSNTVDWDRRGDGLLYLREGKLERFCLDDRSHRVLVESDRPIVEFAPAPHDDLLAIVETLDDGDGELTFDGAPTRLEGVAWSRSGPAHRLRVVCARTGAASGAEFTFAHGLSSPRWRPDGSEIACLALAPRSLAESPEETNGRIERCVLADGSRSPLSAERWIYGFAYAGDGDSLCVAGNDRAWSTATKNEVRAHALRGDAVRSLTDGLDVHVGNYGLSDVQPVVAAALCGGPEEGVVTLATAEARVRLVRLRGDARLDWLTPPEMDVCAFEAAAERDTFYCVGRTRRNPGELYRVRDGVARPLTRFNHALESRVAAGGVTPAYAPSAVSPSGRQHYWLARAECVSGPVPVVVVIHGGPHAAATGTYGYETERLLAAGYAVVSVNLVGSIGWGQAYACAALGRVGDADLRDLLGLVRSFLDDHDWADPDNLFLMGGSYGGLMVSHAVSASNAFRAAVSERSISNWVSFSGTSDIGAAYARSQLGAPLDLGRMLDASPLSRAAAIETPLLLIHGELDRRCPVSQSEELYAQLIRHGRKARLHILRGVGHFYTHSAPPPVRSMRMDRIVAWFAEHRR